MSKMKIPFGTITITNQTKNLINQILATGRVSNGKYVREFEEKFAALTGRKEAVAVSSGTDADILACALLYDFGAKRGDEIILPALAFVATGNAVLHAGFKPVFVDIERDTLNIDANQIERVITKKTKAILAVHNLGKPAEMDKIIRIAQKYKLSVIEDAAEAYGAVYKDRDIGTLGDVATFSTYLAHIISTVEGGVVVTDNADFAEILRSLRNHGSACKCRICTLRAIGGYCPKRFQNGEDTRFLFERVGFSSKMNELEAAVGLGNLEIYQDILTNRRKNLSLLREKFKQFEPYLTTIKERENEKIGPHAFPIIIQKESPFKRQELVNFLEQNGIETRSLFSSMPTQCRGFEFLGYKLGDFPNAEFIGKHGLHIGVHQDLHEEHITYFINKVKEFLTNRIK